MDMEAEEGVDIEALSADVVRNQKIEMMASLPVDVRRYMADNLWPLIETIVQAIAEHDDSIAECIERTEDAIHAETAQEIGKPIGLGLALCKELERRLGPGAPDGRVRNLVAEYRIAAKTALATLQDITIADGEDEDVPLATAPAANDEAEGESDEEEDEEDDQ
jgi:hypothetical protein